MNKLIALDIECLPNYFLVALKSVESGKLILIDMEGADTTLSFNDRRRLRSILKKYTSFGFNSNNYDMPMIQYALTGATCSNLHNLSTKIIDKGQPAWMTYKQYDMRPEFDHFDISEPAPAVMISLKNYGTRLGSKRLWEFFVDPYKPVNADQIHDMKKYCENDVDVTIDLYHAIKDEIDLREHMGKEYGLDLRSKSGAQVAEAVILKMTGFNGSKPSVPKTVQYVAPPCVSFKSYHLNELQETIESHCFEINQKNGQPKEPLWMKHRKTVVGNTTYKVGLGGIHDQNTKTIRVKSDTHTILDIDVASYYPSMILEFGFSPKHIGENFYNVYDDIYKSRLAAKRSGDKMTSDSLKLVLNSSFGKMGSMFSKLYAPDLMLQVTITGQLMLLMLIEEFESKGIEVFYANTDGITIYCPNELLELAKVIVFDWELETGMIMEHEEFASCHIRDVNNFVNITVDGKVKAKGVYGDVSLKKGLQTPVVFRAVREWLRSGIPIKETIDSCTTVNDFLSARTVNGGAMWKGSYIGKMVRWYYSKQGAPIHYKKNGNQVPKTAEGNGVFPMMDLEDRLPKDLDYQWYYDEAVKMLADLGVETLC